MLAFVILYRAQGPETDELEKELREDAVQYGLTFESYRQGINFNGIGWTLPYIVTSFGQGRYIGVEAIRRFLNRPRPQK